MGLKIIGLGLKHYIFDKMNCFDAIIVIISFVEIILGGNSTFSAFRSVRIFRAFRVLRVTKLIRSLQFMKIIIKVIAKTLDSCIYIALLLLLFSFIYSLIGMQFFGGQFYGLEDSGRYNFDTFCNSFVVVF